MNISEKELIKLCKQKKAKAQKLLYDTYHRSLLGICLRYAKSYEEAEDLLQSGMIRIFRTINTYNDVGSFEGWMKRIITNLAIDNFRKNQKHYFHSNIDDLENDTSVECHFDSNLDAKKIIEIIQNLPDGYRIVFNLFAIEGFSHKEIAGKLGITESTSKTQLRKARIKLQTLLNELNQDTKPIANG